MVTGGEVQVRPLRGEEGGREKKVGVCIVRERERERKKGLTQTQKEEIRDNRT